MINNILNAANYESLCDYSIIPPECKLFTSEILTRDAIIFCKTDFIGYLFENIKYSKYNYVLITHHSDYSIDEHIFSFKPDCIKKWFAINPVYNNENLIAIPLGLKTHKGIYVEKVNNEPHYKIEWMSEEIDNLKLVQKEDIIYCNWGNTNPDRNLIINKLNLNNINYKLENNLSFQQYITNMSKYKFVISPPGNGIDCHRTWESLYLGCIPIVIKHKLYDNWLELPILQVNDYSEITNELLENFCKNEFCLDKLNLDYWKKIIKL